MQLPKSARLMICTVAVCVFLYFVPLFRVRKLEPSANLSSHAEQQSSSSVSVENGDTQLGMDSYLETLWNERLPQAAEKAAMANDFLTSASTNLAVARKEFGREVGLGGPTFLFLRGRGRVAAVDKEECRLIIDGQVQSVTLEIGILLGNAVRDATGLISVHDFPNSQEFNQLSAELNARCESEIIQPLRDRLIVGATVEFVGCSEVRSDSDLDPLKLIPVQLQITQPTGSTE